MIESDRQANGLADARVDGVGPLDEVQARLESALA